MEQVIQTSKTRIRTGQRIAVALCIAVVAAWALQNFFLRDFTKPISPVWLPPVAAVLGASGVMQPLSRRELLWKILHMSGLLLMVWTANKLLFDFLTMTGTVGDPATGQPMRVDWPGTLTRLTAFASAVALARQALKAPAKGSKPPAAWYGYAAFLLALPYPLLRIIWALGGTPGISRPGAAGEGFAPLIFAIPWILAAVLSLLLVKPRKWKPRRFLLFAGWTATAIVASIGPIAVWSMIKMLVTGESQVKEDMAIWVFWLFYTSWFLWAIAAFAATRSYQLRSA